MTTATAPEDMLAPLPDAAPSRRAGRAVPARAEQSGLEAGSGGFDGLLLRQGKFFPEHLPRGVAGQHEREGNSLTGRKPEGAARRSEDLLQAIPAPRSHVPHLRTDVGYVEFEQRSERRTLLLVDVEEKGDELPEPLGRLPGHGDFELERVPKRLEQLRLHGAQKVPARGEVVVDGSRGGIRPLGNHVHGQAVRAYLSEHLDRRLDKVPPT
jgi:hypothetical protein